jgi:hypothetical protein
MVSIKSISLYNIHPNEEVLKDWKHFFQKSCNQVLCKCPALNKRQLLQIVSAGGRVKIAARYKQACMQMSRNSIKRAEGVWLRA